MDDRRSRIDRHAMTPRIAWMVWIAVVFATGCTRRSAIPTEMDDVRIEQAPVHESWDLDMLVSEDGSPRFRLTAAHLSHYERKDSTYTLLTGDTDSTRGRVTGILYGASRDTAAWFEADRMIWFEATRRMEARGGVVVRSANGRVLESEHLEWLESERKVQTAGFARITLVDGRLEGYGLVARETLEEVRLANVTGNIMVVDE